MDQDAQPDDRSLLAAHVAGDDEAFGVLFSRHRDRLWAVALRTTGDPEEAADALQDAMVAAFRRAGSYRGESLVTTWLHRIVVNACLDRIRRRKVRRAEALPDDLEDRPTLATSATASATGSAGSGTSTDPEERAILAERRDLVHRALGELSVEQRTSLVLVDMEGYSVDEAARILQVAPGTVKSRCSRGRARLLPILAPLIADSDQPTARPHGEPHGESPGEPSAGNRDGGSRVSSTVHKREGVPPDEG